MCYQFHLRLQVLLLQVVYSLRLNYIITSISSLWVGNCCLNSYWVMILTSSKLWRCHCSVFLRTKTIRLPCCHGNAFQRTLAIATPSTSNKLALHQFLLSFLYTPFPLDLSRVRGHGMLRVLGTVQELWLVCWPDLSSSRVKFFQNLEYREKIKSRKG